MTDRPIIFSGPMVRALLDGRKTQTRRVLRRPTDHFHALHVFPKLDEASLIWSDGKGGIERTVPAPYVPGDRLWVRETWRTALSMDAWKPKKIEESCLEAGYRRPWAPIQYDADGARDNFDDEPSLPGKTRVAIHMPRWVSRITLHVTGVKVERLQDISEADAIAEGIEHEPVHGWRCYLPEPSQQTHWAFPRESFRTLWQSIHGPDAWAANPWVTAVRFKVVRANIDSPEARAA